MTSIGSQLAMEWESMSQAALQREREITSQRSSTTNATPTALSNPVSPIFTPASTGPNTPMGQQPSPGRPSSIGSQSFSNPGGITATNADGNPEAGYRAAPTTDSPKLTPSGVPATKSPRSPFGFGRVTPLLSPGTPLRRHLANMKDYLQEIGHLTTIDPHDAWLPVTESRGGNAYYAAFHNLNATIGFQCLVLPVAFTFLGWTWGIVSLTLFFAWFIYTKWLLIDMHECVPGRRMNRFMELSQAAFGETRGLHIAAPFVIELAIGTCIGLLSFGGSSLILFFQTVCPMCEDPLSPTKWYLVFTVLCVFIAQLPNLHSVAGVSLFGAISAVAFCTLAWALSISVPRPPGVGYSIVSEKKSVAGMFTVLNALGLIIFGFRGHNLVLEIQATMPSSLKRPSRVPMWRGALWAFAGTAFCFVPLSIAGYWAYGDEMLPPGILLSMQVFHGPLMPHELQIAPALLGLTFLLVILNCLCGFQIYAMPMFDAAEWLYTKRTNKKLHPLLRLFGRTCFVFLLFLLAVALPFIKSVAGLTGGLSIPVTLVLPSLMYLKLKKPKRGSFPWCLNWVLAFVGAFFTVAVVAGGVWSVVDKGVKVQFFKPS